MFLPAKDSAMIQNGVAKMEKRHNLNRLNPLVVVGVEQKSDTMLKALTSWLEDGGQVVAPDLAQKRGEICSKCPLNVTGNWWEKISKQPVAEVIKKWLEIKNEMQIGVPIEKEIGLCRVCGCVLRLKNFEPIKYIKDHTDLETMSKFPDYCWIKTESKTP
jgi:hypothetical protein